MSLKVKLMDELKTAMKQKDKIKKNTVTLIRSAIKQVEIDTREDLNDEQIIEIISKQVKQRRDSITEFEKADRQDLLEEAQKELELLLAYLPKQLTEEEVKEIVVSAIAEVGATSSKDIGKVMPIVMGKTKGVADGKLVSTLVRAELNK